MEHGWVFCVFEGDVNMVIDARCSFEHGPWELRPFVLDVFSYASSFLAFKT